MGIAVLYSPTRNGALSRTVSSFVYDAEYSYDDYYQIDSVKVCPRGSKLECVDCHRNHLIWYIIYKNGVDTEMELMCVQNRLI